MIEKNLAHASGFNDLDEVVFDGLTGEAYVDEGLGCQNTSRKNDYVTSWGPTDCFTSPMALRVDNICSLYDDDGHEDD